MGQKITVKILDKDFVLNAINAEKEEIIRLSAKNVNDKIDNFRRKYPSQNIIDIMSLIALNQENISTENIKMLKNLEKEILNIISETDSYLENI